MRRPEQRYRERRLVEEMPIVRTDRRTIAAEDDVATVASTPSMCPAAKGDDRIIRRAYDDSTLIKLWVHKRLGVVVIFLEVPSSKLAPCFIHVICPDCARHYLPLMDKANEHVH
jgi:hypothetical protein